MLPMKRMMIIGQRSQCRHVLKLTYCRLKYYNYMQGRQNSGPGYQKKSSLYAKSESKIYQLNVPVELDLDFQQRLKAKDQLLAELSSRNFTDVNVDQLVDFATFRKLFNLFIIK